MQWNIKQQKEWTTTSHTIDESYKCNAEQKKPDTKCMLYHSVLSISKHAKVPMVLGIKVEYTFCGEIVTGRGTEEVLGVLIMFSS